MRYFIFLLCSSVCLIAKAEINPLRISPVVRAVDQVEEAVVNISTEKVVSVRGFNPFGDDWINEFFNRQPYRNVTRQSLGSGVIIQPDGVILTNEHVILPASKITVTLSDGKEFEAELLGASRRFDLALLKINGSGLFPFLAPARSDDLMIGETVIAIGNPFGLSSSVTTGVISALHRTITFQDSQSNEKHTYYDFIQTDASINPGNSGGPLLNAIGELIGINTAIYQNAEGIGFAIPIDKAKRVMRSLLEKGNIPKIWLGVNVQELTPLLAQNMGLASAEGVLISNVRAQSPGAKAGLLPGDVIQIIGRSRILTPEDYRDRIKDYTPSEGIPFTILRNNEELNIEVTAMEYPFQKPSELEWELLGLKVTDLNSQEFKEYKRVIDQAVVISDVRQGSPAAQVGLARGDLILRVDRSKIETIEQFHQSVRSSSDQDSVSLVIFRRSTAYRVTLPIE